MTVFPRLSRNFLSFLLIAGSALILLGCTGTPQPSLTVSPTGLNLAGSGLSYIANPIPAWVAGQFGSVTLAVSGGTPPYSWKLKQGSSLPAGFNISEGGVLSGTPPLLARGTSELITPPFTLVVTDVQGVQEEVELRVTIMQPKSTSTPTSPTISRPDITTLVIPPPTISRPDITSPVIPSPTISRPDITTPSITRPDVTATPLKPTQTAVAGVKFPYGLTYTGVFSYVYLPEEDRARGINTWKQGSFQLTMTFEPPQSDQILNQSDHTFRDNESWNIRITGVKVTEPGFGTGLDFVAPVFGWARLPLEPPTTSSKPALDLMGFGIRFPNRSNLETRMEPNSISVTTDGMTISNSLDPAYSGFTWGGQVQQGVLSTSQFRGTTFILNRVN